MIRQAVQSDVTIKARIGELTELAIQEVSAERKMQYASLHLRMSLDDNTNNQAASQGFEEESSFDLKSSQQLDDQSEEAQDEFPIMRIGAASLRFNSGESFGLKQTNFVNPDTVTP